MSILESDSDGGNGSQSEEIDPYQLELELSTKIRWFARRESSLINQIKCLSKYIRNENEALAARKQCTNLMMMFWN